MHQRFDVALRILADLGISTDIIDHILVRKDFVSIRLDHHNHDTMSPLVNASRRLGVAPELASLNPETLEAAGLLPPDMAATLMLVGRTNSFAQDEWSEQFEKAFSEAMILDQENTPSF